MKIFKSKPTSPGRRFLLRVRDDFLHKGSSYSSLTCKKNRISGRNNRGRITVRHRGGGHKRNYRIIDFKRSCDDIPAIVERIEYDPNRTAYIALLLYSNGSRRYIISPRGLSVGMNVLSGNDVPIKVGNCTSMLNIPLGSFLHNIEITVGKGAQLSRSAGTFSQLVGKDGRYAILRLSSGEMRKVLIKCRAVIGVVSYAKNSLNVLGKAGVRRWLGYRPTVRGVAMNPVDHPHGGGEGRTSGGRHPVTPWGVLTKGKKTRSVKRYSDRLIIYKKK